MKKTSLCFLVWMTLAVPFAPADDSGMYIVNAKVGYPQILSGEVGWIFGEPQHSADWTTETSGLYASISPGIAGTKLSTGYAELGGVYGWSGLRYSVSYLYMYDDVDRYESNSHYVGPELNLSLMIFTANLGVLWPLDSGDPRIIAGIGIGW